MADGESLAWLIVVPCGAALVVAIALLGAPLGRLLYPPLAPDRLWDWNRPAFSAGESQDQAAYLLALLATAAVALAIAVMRRPAARLGPAAKRAAPLAQLGFGALVTISVLTQYRLRYPPEGIRAWYFPPATWVISAAIAGGVVLAIRNETIRLRLQALLHERPLKHWLAAGTALAVTAAAMTACIDSDTTIVDHAGVRTIIAYPMDEAFAVVNGLTPFVDFHPLYATLWPFVAAVPLVVVAPTLLVFTLTMYVLSVLALVAIFGVLRRSAGSSLVALLLYVPFLAMSLVLIEDSMPKDAYSAGNYFPAVPLRYAGPYLLAWLTARALAASRRRSHLLLFAAGALVALNNANFGLPALGATVVAVLCASGPLRRPIVTGIARDLGIGVAAAVAAVCALTLLRTGALPDLTQQLEYSSYFIGGYSGSSIPAYFGLHTLLYFTFSGALLAAIVRARRAAGNRVLTGMLAWSGVFGLGASSYFIAESGPFQMHIVLSTWALALSLLTLLVLKRLTARPRGRPTVADVAVLIGLGVMVCSIPQLARPWSQLERLRSSSIAGSPYGPLVPDPALHSYVASLAYGRHAFYVKRGAPVALLLESGHRLADGLGVVDVNRYTDVHTLLGPSFLRRVVSDLRRAGGNTIIVDLGSRATEEVTAALRRWGFALATSSGVGSSDPRAVPITSVVGNAMTAKWVDQRNLHPAALRGDRGTLVARYPPRE